MAIWQNPDGLTVKLGVTEAIVGRAGEYRTNTGVRVVEYALNLIDLSTARIILDYNTVLDKNSLIEKVEVETTTTVTGSGATLNIGLVRTDTTTTYDDDGLGTAAVLTTTAMATKGTILTYITGTSGAGALVGTALANNGLLCADYDTAAFTAGRVTVRIYLSFPL